MLMRPSADCLVTIVTPVYNQAATLRETVESVLAQTYENIEYIIINDGSTDSTDSVLASYEGRATIISQENCGQSAALNKAWAQAKGDYLTYLSADDVLYPECIETLVESTDGSAIVYYPDFDLIDASSEKIRTVKLPDYDDEDLKCGLVCQPGLAAIFSTEAFRKVGDWDPTYRFIPDFEFWTRIASYGPFKRIPQVLGGFRVHDDSGSVREVNPEYSDEIIRLVDSRMYEMTPSCLRRAYFQSRIHSSRSHFQSRRYLLGATRYIAALKASPREGLRLKNIRFALSGAVRRLYYRARVLVHRQRSVG